jgi:hypothetical protein
MEYAVELYRHHQGAAGLKSPLVIFGANMRVSAFLASLQPIYR